MGIVQPVPTRGPGGARRKQAGREQGGDLSSGSKVPMLNWDVHPRRCETSAEAMPSFKEKYIFLCGCIRQFCSGALWGRARRSIASLRSWRCFRLAVAVASPVQQAVLRDPRTRLHSGNEQQQRQDLERKTESTGSWLAVHTGFWLRLIELSPVSSRVQKHSWERGLKASSYSQWECVNIRLLRSTNALACFSSHLWTLTPSLCCSLVTTERVPTSHPSHMLVP